MNFSTRCIHNKKRIEDPTGSIVAPLYLSSTFSHPSPTQSTRYEYSRLQNPTRELVEDVICSLEGGDDAFAFSSGMAAIACLMEIFEPGDRILVSWDLYGGTIRLFESVSRKNKLEIVAVDTTNLDAVAEALTPGTKALFVESPTNPMMHVSDIAALAQLARTANALLIVDNTFLTPYFQQPIALGADLVVHSATKYLGGHNDVLAGFIVSAQPALSEKFRFLIKTVGSGLAPFDSWLIARGIKTLPLRMEKHQENALILAAWLQAHPKVTSVLYPGLPTDPSHELSKCQATGFGGMITLYVDSQKTALSTLEHIQLILLAESLGGTETLITYPLTQTHADVPQEELKAKGINDRLLRISVGLECIDDLIFDLDQALKSS